MQKERDVLLSSAQQCAVVVVHAREVSAGLLQVVASSPCEATGSSNLVGAGLYKPFMAKHSKFALCG